MEFVYVIKKENNKYVRYNGYTNNIKNANIFFSWEEAENNKMTSEYTTKAKAVICPRTKNIKSLVEINID